jgi:hypothetical protein
MAPTTIAAMIVMAPMKSVRRIALAANLPRGGVAADKLDHLCPDMQNGNPILP